MGLHLVFGWATHTKKGKEDMKKMMNQMSSSGWEDGEGSALVFSLFCHRLCRKKQDKKQLAFWILCASLLCSSPSTFLCCGVPLMVAIHGNGLFLIFIVLFSLLLVVEYSCKSHFPY